MNLVIVSGPEATGKSNIAQRIAKQLGYVYQSKDQIKESMFDSLDHDTHDSAWFENRAKNEFFKQISNLVVKDQNAVIESNFVGADTNRLIECLNEKVNISELFCESNGFVSFWRFVRRNESGRRHPGHHDRRLYLLVFRESFARFFGIDNKYKPMKLSEKSLCVNTTRMNKVEIEQLCHFIAG